MKKLLLLLFGLIFCIEGAFAGTRHVVRTYQTPNYNYFSADNVQPLHSINNNKLTEMERSIFGKTYERQNSNARINRLEQSVFNRTYPNRPFDERLNNIIVNYNNNSSYTDSYSSMPVPRQSRWQGLRSTLGSMVFGTTTGVTPQVSPYWHRPYYAPNGRQTDYYGNRGWDHRNNQMGSGVGVKILE